MYLIVISPPLQNKFKFVNVYKYIRYTLAWVSSTNISKNLIFDISPDRRHFTNKYIICLLEFWASIMVPISFWYVAWPSERLCGWHTLFVIILKISIGEIIVILSFFITLLAIAHTWASFAALLKLLIDWLVHLSLTYKYVAKLPVTLLPTLIIKNNTNGFRKSWRQSVDWVFKI